jgi:hypothetical protein
MFVRKRTRTRLGQGGYDPWKGRVIPYYQVLRSIRVDGRPMHQVVASWSLHPGLAEAIREREAWITQRKRTLAHCEQALAEGKPWRAFPRQLRNPHEYVQQQIVELRDDVEKNLAELARLRAAHAALGDWRDPAAAAR